MHVAMAGGGPSASHVRSCSTEVFRRQPWLLQENPGKRCGMRFYAGRALQGQGRACSLMGGIGPTLQHQRSRREEEKKMCDSVCLLFFFFFLPKSR
jgi:hypothetical protein